MSRTHALAVLVLVLAAGCTREGAPSEPMETAASDEPPPAVPAQAPALAPDLPSKGPLLAVPSPYSEAYVLGVPAAEPTLGITSSGAIFYAAATLDATIGPVAAPEHTMFQTHVMRSVDGGLTWSDVTARLGPTPLYANVETNDPMLYVDPDTDRVFHLDMHGPAGTCNTLLTSDDEGATWTGPTAACLDTINDHPTIAASRPTTGELPLYPKYVHVCSNMLLRTQCIRSSDGGLTFTQLSFPYEEPGSLLGCSGAHTGHLVADVEGRLYLPKNGCGKPLLSVSADDGATWSVVEVPGTLPPIKGFFVDPSVAVDERGWVYYAYHHASGRLRVAASPDAGKTWLEPRDVAEPTLTATSHMAIAAAGNGFVVAYYGTRAPGGHGAADEELATHGWQGFLTQVDATSWDAPQTWTAEVTPGDPLVRGACGPGRCIGVADFMDVQIGPDGRAWAAFVDVCTGKCASDPASENDDNVGVAATLRGVPNLRLPGTLV